MSNEYDMANPSDEEIARVHKQREWITYFMMIAKACASRSSCLRANVGAVIVRDCSKQSKVSDVMPTVVSLNSPTTISLPRPWPRALPLMPG